MSNILVIVSALYNRNELWPLLRVLKRRNHTFEIVSSKPSISDEHKSKHNSARLHTSITSLNNYEAVVVVSGEPSSTMFYWTDPHCQHLMSLAFEKGLVVAGICAAVPTVGVCAKGKRVSFFPTVANESRLIELGAVLDGASICVDGALVTAANEAMTEMWATDICDVLENKPPTYLMHNSGFVPKGNRRAPKGARHLE